MENSGKTGGGCVVFLALLGLCFIAALWLTGCSAPSRQEAEVRGQTAVATVQSKTEDLAVEAVNKGQGLLGRAKSVVGSLADKAVQTGKSVAGSVKQTGEVVIDKAIFQGKALQIKAALWANGIWSSADGYSIIWIEGDDCHGWAVYHLGVYQKCIGASDEALNSFLN